MIYSKALDTVPYFPLAHWNRPLIQPLHKNTTVSNDDVFLFDKHDKHQRQIEFDNFVDEHHWQELAKGHGRILLDFCDDFFNVLDITEICEVLVKRNIPADNVYMLTMDPLWTDFALKHFHEHGINPHVQEFPYLMHKAKNGQPKKIRPLKRRKRFSLLSRNYREWRLDLYLGMLNNGSLDNSHYSFHRIDPYAQKHYYETQIKQHALDLGYEHSKPIKRWIKNIPYDLGKGGDHSAVLNKYSNLTYDTIHSADVHILIESHWNTYLAGTYHMIESKQYSTQEWAPAFLTEKFYKAILCSVPFICVSTPFFMQEIRRLGYQTFEPLIPEVYDQISDNHNRMQHIHSVINSINNMSQEEVDKQLINLRTVCKQNLKVLNRHLAKPLLTGKFEWMRKYIDLSKI